MDRTYSNIIIYDQFCLWLEYSQVEIDQGSNSFSLNFCVDFLNIKYLQDKNDATKWKICNVIGFLLIERLLKTASYYNPVKVVRLFWVGVWPRTGSWNLVQRYYNINRKKMWNWSSLPWKLQLILNHTKCLKISLLSSVEMSRHVNIRKSYFFSL